MRIDAACSVIAKTLTEQNDCRLSGEVTVRVMFNGGGIRRIICDVNNIPSRHFEITEERSDSHTENTAPVLGDK